MSSPGPLEFFLSEHPREADVLVSLGGDLDVAASEQVSRALRHHLDAGRAITLDLTEVVFMDSSGLAAILTTPRLPERSRIRLVLPRHRQPRQLVEMTGIRDVFAT